MVGTIGVDSHKATHTVVAVDEVGKGLGDKQVRATSEGHLVLVQRAARFLDASRIPVEALRVITDWWGVVGVGRLGASSIAYRHSVPRLALIGHPCSAAALGLIRQPA